MSNILRLKSYKTMLSDGRSSVTSDSIDKGRVLVVVFLGDEPLKASPDGDMLDVEEAFLETAKILRQMRKRYGKPETIDDSRFRLNKAVDIAYSNLESKGKKKCQR